MKHTLFSIMILYASYFDKIKNYVYILLEKVGEEKIMYFDKAGQENTIQTLNIAKQEAINRDIKYVVVASTTGQTALQAAKLFKDTEINLVVVTHNTGFAAEGEQQLKEEIKEEIEKFGAKVYTGTMVLRGIGTALRSRVKYSEEQIIADTLRMFSQGIKVCVEITAMAADAGLIPFDDIIAVAGTASGADTCCLIKANSSNNFFDIKIKEILAKPRNF